MCIVFDSVAFPEAFMSKRQRRDNEEITKRQRRDNEEISSLSLRVQPVHVSERRCVQAGGWVYDSCGGRVAVLMAQGCQVRSQRQPRGAGGGWHGEEAAAVATERRQPLGAAVGGGLLGALGGGGRRGGLRKALRRG